MTPKVAVVALFVAVVVAASSLEGQNHPAAPRTITINMTQTGPTSFAFQPAQLAAQPGDTLKFVQVGSMPHNVQFKRVPAGANLGAAMIGPFLTTSGQTYTLVMDARFVLGRYDFVCTPHEAMGMTGTLTVAPGAAATTSATH